MVQQKSVTGKLLPVWVCKNTGVEYGSPVCPDRVIFGKCVSRRLRKGHIKSKPRKRRKIIKFDSNQSNLFGGYTQGIFGNKKYGNQIAWGNKND